MPFQISTSPSSGAEAARRKLHRASDEDGVAAGAPDDPVARPLDLAGATGNRGRPHHDVNPCSCPTSRHLVRVELGPARLGVVDVAPRQHRDSSQPGAAGELCELSARRLSAGGALRSGSPRRRTRPA